MRKIKLFSCVLFLLTLWNCERTTSGSDALLLELKGTETEIAVEDAKTVLFTVIYDGKNVSNESVIMVTEDNVGEISNLPSPEFATFRPGEYRFRATYKDKVSNIFKLTVTSTSEVSDFFKKTLFTYHTATWCTKCPAAHKDLLSVMAKYPGRSVKISIHGQDDLEVEQGKQLMSAFSV